MSRVRGPREAPQIKSKLKQALDIPIVVSPAVANLRPSYELVAKQLLPIVGRLIFLPKYEVNSRHVAMLWSPGNGFMLWLEGTVQQKDSPVRHKRTRTRSSLRKTHPHCAPLRVAFRKCGLSDSSSFSAHTRVESRVWEVFKFFFISANYLVRAVTKEGRRSYSEDPRRAPATISEIPQGYVL